MLVENNIEKKLSEHCKVRYASIDCGLHTTKESIRQVLHKDGLLKYGRVEESCKR